MSDSIMDIESGLGKIEALIKGLREDRDNARTELAELKRVLDDRELELLAFDEERQKMKNDYEEKITESSREREELESKLAEVASKIRALMPLVEEYSSEKRA